MNWTEAVSAMLSGKRVQRVPTQAPLLDGYTAANELPIESVPEEPLMLMNGCTYDGRPVCVFVGALSRALFTPNSAHTSATDWVVVPNGL